MMGRWSCWYNILYLLTGDAWFMCYCCKWLLISKWFLCDGFQIRIQQMQGKCWSICWTNQQTNTAQTVAIQIQNGRMCHIFHSLWIFNQFGLCLQNTDRVAFWHRIVVLRQFCKVSLKGSDIVFIQLYCFST